MVLEGPEIEKVETREKRQRCARFALNGLEVGCRVDLGYETIFWLRDLSRRSACSRSESTEPAALWSAVAWLPHFHRPV